MVWIPLSNKWGYPPPPLFFFRTRGLFSLSFGGSPSSPPPCPGRMCLFVPFFWASAWNARRKRARRRPPLYGATRGPGAAQRRANTPDHLKQPPDAGGSRRVERGGRVGRSRAGVGGLVVAPRHALLWARALRASGGGVGMGGVREEKRGAGGVGPAGEGGGGGVVGGGGGGGGGLGGPRPGAVRRWGVWEWGGGALFKLRRGAVGGWWAGQLLWGGGGGGGWEVGGGGGGGCVCLRGVFCPLNFVLETVFKHHVIN